jgi:formylglycine-generating enzyme required for sulfatase activity
MGWNYHIGMKLTLIPAGEFQMGGRESAEQTAALLNKDLGEAIGTGICDNEYPQHHVRITRPFFLGTYHLTRGQFRQFVVATKYKTDAEKDGKGAWGYTGEVLDERVKFSWQNTGFEQPDDHPVVNVSWNDALAFCQWLSRKEGKTYRLPTEAEWEYACRAGTTTLYSCGNDPETLAQVGNVLDATAKAKFPYLTSAIKASDGYAFTAPVGHFRSNAFGLFDMHGNAWQWCADRYDAAYYAASPADDPQGPHLGSEHVFRGGSWYDWAGCCRSAYRCGLTPEARCVNLGFRVARIAVE